MNAKTFRSHVRHWWRQEIRPLLITVLVLCAVRSSLADWNDVPSGSMRPTIIEGDRVWVNKLAYDLKVPFTTWHIAEWSNPERGDIVVFYSPYDGARLIKRVIGLPGDTVEVRNAQVFVNGTALVEPYVANPPNYAFGPVQVEPGRYFVMGDNRSNSSDSHVWGTIPRETIVGRAWIIYWPPPNWQIVPHYSYAVAEAR